MTPPGRRFDPVSPGMAVTLKATSKFLKNPDLPIILVLQIDLQLKCEYSADHSFGLNLW